LIGNPVSNGLTLNSSKMQGFGQPENEYIFLANGEIKRKEYLSKASLAERIAEWF
jgi:hypothetical protein